MFEQLLCGKLLFSENILKPQKYKKIPYTLYIYNVILKYTSIYYTVTTLKCSPLFHSTSTLSILDYEESEISQTLKEVLFFLGG